jgi:8-oxo-dGTP diphosphatase
MKIDWQRWVPNLRATLVFVEDKERNEVLLIRKKTGFGKGKVNGPGGKLDPGETETECAIREVMEELHVRVIDPVKRGELWFQFTDGLAMHVAVFHSTRHEGEPVETVEAEPLWTRVDAIPFEQMWADDRHWLHRMLTTDENFLGRFMFDGEEMRTCDVTWSAPKAAV